MLCVLIDVLILYLFTKCTKSQELEGVEIKTFYNLTQNVDGEDIVFRVVRGVAAKLGDAPYQISLKTRTYSKQTRSFVYASICGGTLIGHRKILTAAHCVVKRRSSSRCTKGKLTRRALMRLMAVAGQLNNIEKYQSVDSPTKGQWRRLSGGRYPHRYRFPKQDIAVLFTVHVFQYTQYIFAVPYAISDIDYGSKECKLSGFGRLSDYKSSPILMMANLKILTKKQCSVIHRSRMDRFICTSDQTSDSHKGDSGGPLFCSNTGDAADKQNRGVVVGVVSGKVMHRPMSTFFTRVSSYKSLLANSNNLALSYILLICTLLITL